MKTETVDGGTIETWTPQEVWDAYSQGKIALIDVRTPQEYMLEHVEGALLLPMPFFDSEKLPSQQGKRLVLYCGSSARSGRIASACAAKGMVPVTHMEGGFAAWKQACLPYMGTDMATGAPKRVPGQQD